MSRGGGKATASSSNGSGVAQEMVDRMVIAVKNAHKAIQVLKDENDQLRTENADLKRQLAEMELQTLERVTAEVTCRTSVSSFSTRRSSSPSVIAVKPTPPIFAEPPADCLLASPLSSPPKYNAAKASKAPKVAGAIPARLVFIPDISDSRPVQEPINDVDLKVLLAGGPAVPFPGHVVNGAPTLHAPRQSDTFSKPAPSTSHYSLASILSSQKRAPSVLEAPLLPTRIRKRSADDGQAPLTGYVYPQVHEMQQPSHCKALLALLSSANYRTIGNHLMSVPIPVAAKCVIAHVSNAITKQEFELWKASTSTSTGHPLPPQGCLRSVILLEKVVLAIAHDHASGPGYCADLLKAMSDRLLGEARSRSASSPLQLLFVGMESLTPEDWQRGIAQLVDVLSVRGAPPVCVASSCAPPAVATPTAAAAPAISEVGAVSIDTDVDAADWMLELDKEDSNDQAGEDAPVAETSCSVTKGEIERNADMQDLCGGKETVEDADSSDDESMEERQVYHSDSRAEGDEADCAAGGDEGTTEPAAVAVMELWPVRPLHGNDGHDIAADALLLREQHDCLVMTLLLRCLRSLMMEADERSMLEDLVSFALPACSAGLYYALLEVGVDTTSECLESALRLAHAVTTMTASTLERSWGGLSLQPPVVGHMKDLVTQRCQLLLRRLAGYTPSWPALPVELAQLPGGCTGAEGQAMRWRAKRQVWAQGLCALLDRVLRVDVRGSGASAMGDLFGWPSWHQDVDLLKRYVQETAVGGQARALVRAVTCPEAAELQSIHGHPARFQSHWRAVVGSSGSLLAVTTALRVLDSTLVTALRTQFDPISLGGRTGATLVGVRLVAQFSTKMTVLKDLLAGVVKLQPNSRLVAPLLANYLSVHVQRVHNSKIAASLAAQRGVLLTKGALTEYCSIRFEELEAIAEVLDAIASEFIVDPSPITRKPVESQTVQSIDDILTMDVDEEDDEQEKPETLSPEQALVAAKIAKVVRLHEDLSRLLAFVPLEKYLALLSYQLEGLLRFLVDDCEEGRDGRLECALEVARVLQALPGPGGLRCRAEVIVLVHRLRQSSPVWTRREVRQAVSLSTQWAATAPLALVINLDRRPDRWLRMLGQAAQWRFTALRVAAVDGTQLKDQPSLVPEDCVTAAWNTSLNSLFDPRCVKGSVIALTSSERACAMSHLQVWRAIHSLYSSAQSTPDDAPGTVPADPQLAQALTLTRCLHQGPMHDFFLICEDDMLLRMNPISSFTKAGGQASRRSFGYTRSFQQELAYLAQKLPPQVDVCYLGGTLPRKSAAFKSLPAKKMFLRVNYLWGLHAYLVRGPSVAKILAYLPINMPVDNFLASLAYSKVIEVAVLAKPVAEQGTPQSRRLDSDIFHSGTSNKLYEHEVAGGRNTKRARP